MGRLSWIFRVASKCHHKCPCEREIEGSYVYRAGESNITTKAAIPVMQPQAKEYQQLSEVGRGMGQISPLGKSTGLPAPCFQPSETDFRVLASRSMTQSISIVLRPQVCDNLQQPQETNTATVIPSATPILLCQVMQVHVWGIRTWTTLEDHYFA